MSELVYDPRTKTAIRDKVFDFIYAPVHLAFQQRLDTLIRANSNHHGNQQGYMRYRNKLYAMKSLQGVRPPRVVNRCHPAVRPLMREYMADIEKLNQKEIPYVLSFISQVLNASNSLQDYFRVFPESIHQPIRDLVADCNCRSHSLTDQQVEELQEKNAVPISLMKQRMVLNLLHK